MDNYELLYKVNTIFNQEVLPLLSQKLEPIYSINFGNYLMAMEGFPKCTNIAEILYYNNLPYTFSIEFLKRFQDKCLGYCSMNPEQISQMGYYRVIYQFSPTFHAQVGVGIFFPPGAKPTKILIGNFFAMKNYDDYHKFMQDNNDLIIKKDPTEMVTPAGFHNK